MQIVHSTVLKDYKEHARKCVVQFSWAQHSKGMVVCQFSKQLRKSIIEQNQQQTDGKTGWTDPPASTLDPSNLKTNKTIKHARKTCQFGTSASRDDWSFSAPLEMRKLSRINDAVKTACTPRVRVNIPYTVQQLQ